MSRHPVIEARAAPAAGIQPAADAHAIAQRLDDVVLAAPAALGSVASQLDAEDSALLRGVQHVREHLVVLHDRFVGIADLAEATVERMRIVAAEEEDP